MKLIHKMFIVALSITVVAALASCNKSGSNSSSGSARSEAPQQPAGPAPEIPAEPPTFTFTGTELKIELEEMYSEEFLIFADSTASGGYAAKLMSEESIAKAFVTFPAGDYLGLVNENAPDGAHDAFNVFVDGVAYRSFPSDPPLGTYELTERSPINFTIEAEKTVEVRIQQHDPDRPNKPGETGMSLDYIIFTKQ